MAKFVVIINNKENDLGYIGMVGEVYSFPKRYLRHFEIGTQIIYYTKNNELPESFDNKPHYFGTATVTGISSSSKKGTYVIEIDDFVRFERAVPFRKDDGSHYEVDNGKRNQYWDGVRVITEEVFDTILKDGGCVLSTPSIEYDDNRIDADNYRSNEYEEGKPIRVYTTKYERKPWVREAVLKHANFDYSCCVCGINMEQVYGELGRQYIHIHHNKPLYKGVRKGEIDYSDFDIVCPNCHSMIHRKRNNCISVSELREILVNKE